MCTALENIIIMHVCKLHNLILRDNINIRNIADTLEYLHNERSQTKHTYKNCMIIVMWPKLLIRNMMSIQFVMG